MRETKISEVRPEPCHTRMADVVVVDGRQMLKIKCRRCTKATGKDAYHYIPTTSGLVGK